MITLVTVLVTISFSLIIHSCIASVEFGFKTPDRNKANWGTIISREPVTVTLYWEQSRYQCTLYATEFNTIYSCDTSNIKSTRHCDTTSSLNLVKYGLQIDNEEYGYKYIDSIIIKDMQNDITNTYTFEYFCVNFSIFTTESGTDMHFTPSEYKILDQCMNSVQGFDIVELKKHYIYDFHLIFTFNLSNISNGLESNLIATRQARQCVPVGYNCVKQTIVTKLYGSDPGAGVPYWTELLYYQGRINQVKSWGIYDDFSKIQRIVDFTWSSDLMASNTDKPNRPSTRIHQCSPFKLDHDDYLNGYRVIEDNNAEPNIVALYFYTFKKHIYKCDSNYSINNHSIDSGVVLFDGYYLSGFEKISNEGFLIYALAFQFMSLNNTDIDPECDDLNKYILVSTKKSWFDANEFCNQRYNTSLATIVTDKDLEIVTLIRANREEFYQDDLWIGLIDLNENGTWHWIDETECDYDTHWADGSPTPVNDYPYINGNCAAISHSYVHGSFVNPKCGYKLMFLCNTPQWSAITTHPTIEPTNNPTNNPTNSPTNHPTNSPTNNPTNSPTNPPTMDPNMIVTNQTASVTDSKNTEQESILDTVTNNAKIVLVLCALILIVGMACACCIFKCYQSTLRKKQMLTDHSSNLNNNDINLEQKRMRKNGYLKFNSKSNIDQINEEL